MRRGNGPAAIPVPDPTTRRSGTSSIRARGVVAGYNGSGVQILINDEASTTRPDLAKLDVAPVTSTSLRRGRARHGLRVAGGRRLELALWSRCAPNASLASCVIFRALRPARVPGLRRGLPRVGLTSTTLPQTAGASTIAGAPPLGGLPVRVPLGRVLPCDVRRRRLVRGDLSRPASRGRDYCTYYLRRRRRLSRIRSLPRPCYGQLSTAAHDKLVEGATAGRRV